MGIPRNWSGNSYADICEREWEEREKARMELERIEEEQEDSDDSENS